MSMVRVLSDNLKLFTMVEILAVTGRLFQTTSPTDLKDGMVHCTFFVLSTRDILQAC